MRYLSRLGTAAAQYARLGWPVVPVHNPVPRGCSCSRGAACGSVGKHPRLRDWTTQATTDVERVVRWWRQWPHANVGITTGTRSGVVVLDVDTGAGGERSLAAVRRDHAIPRTAIAGTGSGRHLYFRATGDVANSVARLGPGLDVRGNGGFVVAPPSRHANGRAYRWIVPRPLADLPPSLLTALQPPAPEDTDSTPAVHDVGAYGRSALEDEARAVAHAAPHTANNTLNLAAFRLGQLIPAGVLREHDIVAALSVAARARGVPEREAARTIRSGIRGGMKHPRDVSLQRGLPSRCVGVGDATQDLTS